MAIGSHFGQKQMATLLITPKLISPNNRAHIWWQAPTYLLPRCSSICFDWFFYKLNKCVWTAWASRLSQVKVNARDRAIQSPKQGCLPSWDYQFKARSLRECSLHHEWKGTRLIVAKSLWNLRRCLADAAQKHRRYLCLIHVHWWQASFLHYCSKISKRSITFAEYIDWKSSNAKYP